MMHRYVLAAALVACSHPASPVPPPAKPEPRIQFGGTWLALGAHGEIFACRDRACADPELLGTHDGHGRVRDPSGALIVDTAADGTIGGAFTPRLRLRDGALVSADEGTIAAIDGDHLTFPFHACDPEICLAHDLDRAQLLTGLYAIAIAGLTGDVVACSTGACGSQHVFLAPK